MGVCAYCNEEMAPSYLPPNGQEQARCNGRPAHNECALRSTLGGIGHLWNHQYWCLEKHDPDAGLSYRVSGLLVSAWVRQHGIDAAVNR